MKRSRLGTMPLSAEAEAAGFAFAPFDEAEAAGDTISMPLRCRGSAGGQAGRQREGQGSAKGGRQGYYE